MKASHHPFEPGRLAALRAYDILDTPREADFDQIVLLASQICDTPISVVNLVDLDRQWFKAEVGLGVRETPLDTSLCAHAILEDDFVEIPDTLADARMADNPLCTAEGGLRFYAGALLRSKRGYPIGTLCVLDTRPRTLTPMQRETLKVLAHQVMTQLDLRAIIASESMLRSEIDHRVKNSLQAVGAFVSLERNASQDAGARGSLERVERQIGLVANLHDHLGRTGDAEKIQLGSYLDQAITLIDSTLAKGISVEGRFEEVEVTPREASIVATIVNELATNAAKHSLARPSGRILLTGTQNRGTGYRLVCSDDAGSRIPEAADPQARVGLGLKILRASVRQLGGTMIVKHDDSGYSTELDLNFADPG